LSSLFLDFSIDFFDTWDFRFPIGSIIFFSLISSSFPSKSESLVSDFLVFSSSSFSDSDKISEDLSLSSFFSSSSSISACYILPIIIVFARITLVDFDLPLLLIICGCFLGRIFFPVSYIEKPTDFNLSFFC